ncbi:MAG: DUF222 domain-containing protein [Candidatus Rokuibacteriota bacterium]|nr:MAG: DUF222 domain-containing protein [Candidatus Rokubacteria bacterium]
MPRVSASLLLPRPPLAPSRRWVASATRSRSWPRVDRKAEAEETTRRHRSRALHVYQGEDGMVVIRGRLEPEVGAVLIQALAAAREELYQRARAKQARDVPAGAGVVDVPAETPTMAQQQADALGLLAETALHHGIEPGAPGERYQVVVHVDVQVLADADAPASPCSRAERAFRQKRLSALHVTRAAW